MKYLEYFEYSLISHCPLIFLKLLLLLLYYDFLFYIVDNERFQDLNRKIQNTRMLQKAHTRECMH